jgi:hypothetical protein
MSLTVWPEAPELAGAVMNAAWPEEAVPMCEDAGPREAGHGRGSPARAHGGIIEPMAQFG